MASRTLAIVVHYGDPRLTEGAVTSLSGGTLRPNRIVVVDNSVGDHDLATSLSIIPGALLLKPRRNLGFAGGVNDALDRALDPDVHYVWLLNNDASVRPEAAQELLAASDRAGDHALVSSLIVDTKTSRIWFTRSRYFPWWMRSWLDRTAIPGPATDVILVERPSWRSIEYLPACSLLVPAAVIKQVGGFDRRFFVYGEDVDYSLRAVRAGFKLVLASRSIVDHQTSSASTATGKIRGIAKGAFLLTARHYPWLIPFALPAAILEGTRRAMSQRDSSLLSARLQGYADAVRLLAGWRHRAP